MAPDSVVTAIRRVPVTEGRPVPVDLDEKIPHPGVPRATQAVSTSNPDPKHLKDKTVMEQHVLFWDQDGDGKIYPLDTYWGFFYLGFGYILSAIAVVVIHGTFSYPTQRTWLPDPKFSINVDTIHQGKHGSDSETYDTEGRFVPQKFEEIFTKYARTRKDALTLKEMLAMARGNRNIMDPVGWSAAIFEWGSTYYICHDKEGFVSKEKIRGVYDGSIFYKIAEENQNKAKKLQARKREATIARQKEQ